jgi:ATP-dependent Lon protease
LNQLLHIPLEDSVVFPNMSVTLTVDVAEGERVLLVPVHEGAYADVGTVAEATNVVRLPGGARAATLSGLHRGVAGAAQTGSDGRLRVEVEERPDEEPPRVQTAELEREYRALVEEILDLRDADPRIHDFVRSISGACAGRHNCVRPRHLLRGEDRAALEGRRRRAPRARSEASARASRRAASPPAYP